MKHLSVIGYIGWIVLGLVQFAAMLNGLRDVLGGFFGTVVAFLLGQIPIIGTILGIRGAVVNWDWSVLQAIGLLVGAPIVLVFLIGWSSRYNEK